MVIVEGLSVIVKVADLELRYPGGFVGFGQDVPNKTLCTDGELARVGFMSPADLEGFVRHLQRRGMHFRRNGRVADVAVVDQLRGLTVPCDWLEIHKVTHDGGTVAAGALKGGAATGVAAPDGWQFSESLSRSYTYVPAEQTNKLEYLRHDNGLDVYRSPLTGGEVYAGRTGRGTPDAADGNDDFAAIERIAKRALDLASEAETAMASRQVARGREIFSELQNMLLPEARRFAESSQSEPTFGRFALGLVLRVQQRYSDAIMEYLRVLDVLPSNINALQELVLCMGELGMHDEALTYARAAAHAEPESAAVLGDLAMCLINVRRKAEARQALDKALLLDPNDEKNLYIDAHFERYLRRTPKR